MAVDASVVICTRDRPALLRQAVAAIAAQDHPGPIETIVVFDQSEVDTSIASDDPHRPVRVTANLRTPGLPGGRNTGASLRSEEHTSELQSLMRISYAVFCLKQ